MAGGGDCCIGHAKQLWLLEVMNLSEARGVGGTYDTRVPLQVLTILLLALFRR